MPIEFNCQVCRQRLSTPDGSAGRQCRCPDCDTLLTVPSRSTAALGHREPPGGAESASAHRQPSAPDSQFHQPTIEPSARLLKIPCPRCRFELVSSPSLLGTKGQCRNCQHIFTIAGSDSGPAAASDSDSPDLVFHCPACAQLFAGQADMEGKKGKCHACGEVFVIELEPAPTTTEIPTGARPAAPSLSPSRPSEAKLVAPRPPTTARKNAAMSSGSTRQVPIQFHCQSCSGVMAVPASTSGQQTLCPYCGESLTIPGVPDTLRSPAVSRAGASAGRHPSQSASPANQTERNLWTALSDETSATPYNPYSAPDLSPLDSASSEMWSTSATRGKRIRGLTFSNAVALTFDSLFPFCLVAPVLFGISSVITLVAFLLFGIIGGLAMSSFNLVEETSRRAVGFGVLAGVGLIGALVFTAALCMTCNTALHAVRGKRISSRVVFNTGAAYGGMLIIVLGMFAFYTLRRYSAAYVMEHAAQFGDPRTVAVIVGAIIIALILFESVLTYLWSFIPFALLDGQSLPQAMWTSTSISIRHFSVVLPVLIFGRLLYLLAGIVTLGLGLVLLIGALLYLNAAIYRLAED